MSKLSDAEIQSALSELGDWNLNLATDQKKQIGKTIQFTGFQQALLFVNSVGLLAEKANHHPDILICWNRVTLSLVTHDAGGLTRKDFDLAAEINRLPII